MRRNLNTTWLRNFITLCLLSAVFSTYSMAALAATPANKSLTGEIIISGRNISDKSPFVMLNGERAFSGHTFFSSGTIATSENTPAIVRLGKLGFVNLSPNTVLSLTLSENSISGTLSAGKIKVSNNQGVSVKINTPDGDVTNDAAQSSLFIVDVLSGKTNTVTEQGLVYLNNGNASVPVNPAQQDDDDKSSNNITIPLIIFSAIVIGTVAYVALNDNDDEGVVSPIR